MLTMVFHSSGTDLVAEQRAEPDITDYDVLIRVEACGVCRTDLHIRAGELPDIDYPIVPGHQVVGRVVAAGTRSPVTIGERVGVAWLGWTCGQCDYCRTGRENLCDAARFHGYQLDGGYAEYMRADGRYCFPLDPALPAATTAPLLCAGLIGFRSLRMAGDARRIGLYGFGSAAHIVTQVATHEKREIYAFTRPGDTDACEFALEIGATWAGGSDQPAPCDLDAALIFAPDGTLVPKALKDVRKGGMIICAGIHMTDIPSFPYSHLWGERQIRSVANLTRQDGHDFMALAAEGFLHPRVTTYPLADANAALADLANGTLTGTAVLIVD
jgi:propanol-preferring alcohol dehydrogenase